APCVINLSCPYDPNSVNCSNSPYGAGCVNYNVNCTAIVLDQVGQTLPTNANVTLSGTAFCGYTDSGGGISTVQVYDRTNGSNTPITSNFRLTGNSVFSVQWNTAGVLGTRTIVVIATGTCGTLAQQFAVSVGAPGLTVSAPVGLTAAATGPSSV